MSTRKGAPRLQASPFRAPAGHTAIPALIEIPSETPRHPVKRRLAAELRAMEAEGLVEWRLRPDGVLGLHLTPRGEQARAQVRGMEHGTRE